MVQGIDAGVDSGIDANHPAPESFPCVMQEAAGIRTDEDGNPVLRQWPVIARVPQGPARYALCHEPRPLVFSTPFCTAPGMPDCFYTEPGHVLSDCNQRPVHRETGGGLLIECGWVIESDYDGDGAWERYDTLIGTHVVVI